MQLQIVLLVVLLKSDVLQAVSSQYVAYVLTLLMPSTIVSYINADLGPDPNYTWINVSWNVAASVMVTVGGRVSLACNP